MKSLLLHWNNLGLTRKFSLVFNILLSLILLLAISSYASFLYINKAEEDIRKSTQLERLVLQMDLGQQKARQLIGSFFLHYPLSTLQEAHERFAQPSVREISRVITLSKELKDLLSEDTKTTYAGISEADLNLYLASAKRFADTSIEAVELVSRRGSPETGIQLDLRNKALLIATTLSPFPAFRNQYNSIVITYKEYLITRQRPIMQTALNMFDELYQDINQSDAFTQEQKKQFTRQFVETSQLAVELLEIDLAIAGKIKDFSLQEKITEPVSLKLTQLSRQEAQRAAVNIQRTQRVITSIILTIALLAFFAVLSLARLMHASVTYKVLHLAKAAGEYSKGNLQARVSFEGGDELGQLGANFNAMAERLNGLVTTLEEMIGKRTTDLKVSESFYRQLFDHGSNAIAIYKAVNKGKDFVFLDFNRAAEQIEDIRKNDMVGKTITEVFPAIKESGLLEVFREVWESGIPVFHPPFFYNDGRIEGWRQNRVYKLPTGEIVSMYDDLTRQKRAEQEKQLMEQQLQQAQKMEAIGLLAGGVAHDLNNILTAVVNYPEILLLQIEEDSPLRAPVTQIRESGLRAAAVVADLLTVARGVANQMDTADPNQLITTFLDSSEFSQIKTSHSHISYAQDPGNKISNISCSTVHVIKCIMNLVINASEAIAEKGMVTIRSRNKTIDTRQAVKYGLSPGIYVAVSVSDNGSGIAAEDIEHIFEPFYTKKVMGQKSGTGLGLSIVWNTMLDHGGRVVVHSSKKGTCFTLYFPATKSELAQFEQPPVFSDLQGNGESILIVDDEPQLREIAGKILQQLGYKTVCSKSGEDALSYLQQHSVDLILLDMIMDPGMNGRKTYEQIITMYPQQKALLVSGFSENAEVDKTLALGASAFIKKPYAMTELGEAVLKVLAEGSDGESV